MYYTCIIKQVSTALKPTPTNLRAVQTMKIITLISVENKKWTL